MPLKKGEQVLIKNPRALLGTVIERRPGDDGLPEEQAHYLIKISEERFYLSTDLEPAEQPSDKLERYSPEWTAEMNQFVESGQRWIANPNDMEALEQFSESGRKLGIIVPKDKAESKPEESSYKKRGIVYL